MLSWRKMSGSRQGSQTWSSFQKAILLTGWSFGTSTLARVIDFNKSNSEQTGGFHAALGPKPSHGRADGVPPQIGPWSACTGLAALEMQPCLGAI